MLNDYVKIIDKWSHNYARFSDEFDFSGLNYDSIDSFSLTMKYRDTHDSHWFLFREKWTVRIGQSAYHSAINKVDDWAIQTFIVDSSIDTFENMITDHTLKLWFSEKSLAPNKFKLDYVELEIYGTLVPLPGAIWLILTGLGFAGLRKKLMNKLP